MIDETVYELVISQIPKDTPHRKLYNLFYTYLRILQRTDPYISEDVIIELFQNLTLQQIITISNATHSYYYSLDELLSNPNNYLKGVSLWRRFSASFNAILLQKLVIQKSTGE